MENNVKVVVVSNKERWLKNFGYLIWYWLLCLLLPFLVSLTIFDSRGNTNSTKRLILLLIFIQPFFVFTPYRFAKLNNLDEKIIFILFGLTIPFMYIYLAIKFIPSIMISRIIFG